MLVRQNQDPDSGLDKAWTQGEVALWKECRKLNKNLRSAINDSDGSNEQFKILMRGRLQEIECRASTIMDDRTLSLASQERLLHMYRRQLAIVYGEIKMCDLSPAARRAVDEDDAYIALGRQYVWPLWKRS
jgi:hypothetical protein